LIENSVVKKFFTTAANELAEAEYEKFNRRRISQKDLLGGDFERTIKQVTEGKRRKKK
jgi:hypothetical protein